MKSEVMSRIGKELLKLRIDNGFSIEELSKKSKLNKDTLYRYEKGNGNNFDTLARILGVYDLDFKIFFDIVYANMQNNDEINNIPTEISNAIKT